MRLIPQKIRKKFKDDGCFICGVRPVERNHALIYAGKQINEEYAIIPLCVKHHRGNNGTIFNHVKERCELEAIKNGLQNLKIKYPKFNWTRRLQFLTNKYEDTHKTSIS